MIKILKRKGKIMNRKKTGVLSYILRIYVFLMVCIYPLYFENGYYNIGVAKNNFFIVVSTLMMAFLLIVWGIDRLVFTKQNRMLIDLKKISVTERFIYIYMLAIVLSFLFSEYKNDVFWGSKGWYLGTFPLLLLSGFVIFLIHMWKDSMWILYSCLISSGIVFFLGVCNRFSYYPISMKLENPGFISTLGNINWFCGYMSVIVPIGAGLFVLLEDDDYNHIWKKWLLMLYVWIAFIAGFCQGSESFFVWNGILLFCLLWLSVKKIYRLKKWFLLITLWGVAGQTVRLLKVLLPGKYNYGEAMLIDTNSTLLIAVFSLLIYLIMQWGLKEDKEIPIAMQKGIHILLISILSISVLFWIILSVYNTKIGIPFLEDVSFCVYDENWGNGRGVIYKTAVGMIKEMSLIQVLFGVGADGFSAFAYSVPEIKEYLISIFGKSTLTNAHCEILNNLINLGLLGTISFYGILFSLFFRCMRIGNRNKYVYIYALPIICYFGNNIVSFAQILNIPFLFLTIGIGENYLKKKVDYNTN